MTTDGGVDPPAQVFGIDIQTCSACGGALRIIACIENPAVINKIPTHLDKKEAYAEPARLPPCRAPPQAVCSSNPPITTPSTRAALTLMGTAGQRSA